MIPFKAILTNFHQMAVTQQAEDINRDTRENLHYQDLYIGRSSRPGSMDRLRRSVSEIIDESDDDSDPEASLSSRIRRGLKTKLEWKGGIWRELNGALGDLGTFVPAALALSLVKGLDLGTTLVFTGIFNLATGLLFGIPIPVQPMSAIVVASIASNHLTVPQIMAAGIITGLVLGFLGITGLIDYIYRVIPFPAVRGLMLYSGLMTVFRGVKNILLKQDLATMQSLGFRSWLGVDGFVLPMSMLLFVGVVTGIRKVLVEKIRRRELLGNDGVLSVTESLTDSIDAPLLRDAIDDEVEEGIWSRTVMNFPTALIILLTALVLALHRNPSILKNLEWGPSPLKLVKFSWEDWNVGLLEAAVYEIPASIFTSVLSLSRLSSDYFPRHEATPSALCLSVWAMNWLGCWFGAVPVDHGAVGLAGQHKFGARSGLSMVILGTVKIVVGLLLGSSLLGVLSEFPESLLGVLFLWSGIEMVWVCREPTACDHVFVMLAVAVGSILIYSVAYNTTIGFLGGIIVYLFLNRY